MMWYGRIQRKKEETETDTLYYFTHLQTEIGKWKGRKTDILYV
jgi:hypothetical protein